MAKLPEGISYQPGFLPEQVEQSILEGIRRHCFPQLSNLAAGRRRRVIQYGLTPGPPIPEFLEDLSLRCEDWVGIAPEFLTEAMVIEYEPGSAVDWHHDAVLRGSIVGVSLAGPGRICFRDSQSPHPRTARLRLEPRSVYALSGPACARWLRHIPPLEARRYSVVFRAVRPRRTEEHYCFDATRPSSFSPLLLPLPVG